MKTWVEEFKLALIQEDINKIESLLDEPKFDNSELEQVQALTKEAIKLVSQKREYTSSEIKKFQLASKYIKA